MIISGDRKSIDLNSLPIRDVEKIYDGILYGIGFATDEDDIDELISRLEITKVILKKKIKKLRERFKKNEFHC